MPFGDNKELGFLSDLAIQQVLAVTNQVQQTPKNETHWPRFHTRRTKDNFRLIRGRSVGNQSGPIITIDTIVPLSHSVDPVYGNLSGTVLVANTIYPRSFVDAEWVDAVYSPAIISIPGTGTIATSYVDWETLQTGSGATQPILRRFQLTHRKLRTDTTGTGRWLDDSDNMIGTYVTIYDPELQFTGYQQGGVFTDSQAFRGIALLRSDLGTGTGHPLDDRWEMIEMEGFAEFITATVGTAGYLYSFNLSLNDPWMWHSPADPAGTGEHQPYVTVIDPLFGLSGVAVGTIILLRIYDRDTLPPTYFAVRTTSSDRLCAAVDADTNPRTLINLLDPVESSGTGADAIYVNFESFMSGGDWKVGGWIRASEIGTGIGTGTGSDRLVAATTSDSSPATLLEKLANNAPSSGAGTGLRIVKFESVSGGSLVQGWVDIGTGTDNDRKVAAGTGDASPGVLIEKLTDLGPSSGAVDPIYIKFELTDGGTKVRGWIDNPSAGTGGASYSFECGLLESGGIVVVYPGDLAGSGLEPVDFPASCRLQVKPCDVLKMLPNDSGDPSEGVWIPAVVSGECKLLPTTQTCCPS